MDVSNLRSSHLVECYQPFLTVVVVKPLPLFDLARFRVLPNVILHPGFNDESFITCRIQSLKLTQSQTSIPNFDSLKTSIDPTRIDAATMCYLQKI